VTRRINSFAFCIYLFQIQKQDKQKITNTFQLTIQCSINQILSQSPRHKNVQHKTLLIIIWISESFVILLHMPSSK